MKKFHDKQAKKRNDFEINDSVLIKLFEKWVPGRIIQKWKTPRSYVVLIDGKEYRRNSRDIRLFRIENTKDNGSCIARSSMTGDSYDDDATQHRLRSGKTYRITK